MNSVYELVKQFKKKHPLTIAWRLKANSKVVNKFVNPDEEVIYAFTAQKGKYKINSDSGLIHIYKQFKCSP